MTQHRCWVYGDNVNTDVIFPGRYTYTLHTPGEIAAHALEDLDPAFAANVQPGDVIVAGHNWGCGSSREQAVTALKYAGVEIIIAASFGRIYFRNCINHGLLPVECPELHTLVQTGDVICIDREAGIITGCNQAFGIPPLSPSAQRILDAGGLLPMLQQHFEQVRVNGGSHNGHSR
ncbi:MAG: 3-isopropylmalate dehydratase [Anaerolineae bacterium]|jgi:3-isopropylmalate/(R)-2-methylmalate dehydratase small subunit|nr:3-isopropylmalate dehydratase [Anaerolineae bacterium]